MPRLAAVNGLPRLLLACLLCATACVHRDIPLRLRVQETLSNSGPLFSLALYQSVGVDLKPGQRVELVPDGRLTETFEAEIRQAHESIHLLVSSWHPGEASERLIRALTERPPGVTCRLLVDALHSPGFQTTVEARLVQTGCEVRTFRPIIGDEVVFSDDRLEARNHRELLIRDGRSGLTGGAGVGAMDARRDTYVHVEGPAVRQFQQAFARDWLEAGGGLLPESAFPTVPSQGEARAGFVPSTGSPSLSHSERMVQVLMAAAHRRLWLTNACFIPSASTLDTLIRKAEEGVDVRILVPGLVGTRSASVLDAQRSLYERLLDKGVRLWEYKRAPLQARTLVVDDHLVAVGSTSLEPNSNAMLEEGAVVVEDAPLTQALASRFEEDLAGSVEVLQSQWKARSWSEHFTYELPITNAGCR